MLDREGEVKIKKVRVKCRTPNKRFGKIGG